MWATNPYESRSMLNIRSLAFVLALTTWATYSQAENWPRHRGTTGQGHSSETVPAKWTAKDVLWRMPLKGRGQSSPVIWEDRIFLTTATDKGKQRWVMCLDRASGKTLWEKSVGSSTSESLHKMNSWATPSCVTDGERVVAFFGPGGIHCFDMDGKPQWSRNLGGFPGGWGIAASPIILGDQIIQNCDAAGSSYLIALDKKTGKPIWKTKRADKPKGGWSTPVLIGSGATQELVLNGEFGVKGYDPKSGKELWFTKSFNGRGTPMPVFGNGVLYVVNGKPGDVYAVKPGGKGTVKKVWHSARKGGRDLPSPILVDKYLLVVSMSGYATCYDAPSGKMLWHDRLNKPSSASPITAGGKIYVQTESGTILVIEPGPKLNVVAKNELGQTDDEIFRASLAISGGRIYARSDKAIYCVGSR
jgi:outer membrane protein assembly factor BamB